MNIFESALLEISGLLTERYGLCDVKNVTKDIMAAFKKKPKKKGLRLYDLDIPDNVMIDYRSFLRQPIQYINISNEFLRCRMEVVNEVVYGKPVEFITVWFPNADNTLAGGAFLEKSSDPKNGKLYLAVIGDFNIDTLVHEIRHAFDAVQDVVLGTKLIEPQNVLYTIENCESFNSFLYLMTETEMNAYLQTAELEFEQYFNSAAMSYKFVSASKGGIFKLNKEKIEQLKAGLRTLKSPEDFYCPMPKFMTYKDTIMKNADTFKHFIFYNDITEFTEVGSDKYESICKEALLNKSEKRRPVEDSEYIIKCLFSRVHWNYSKYLNKAKQLKDIMSAYEHFIGDKLYVNVKKVYMHYYANYCKVIYSVIENIEKLYEEENKT